MLSSKFGEFGLKVTAPIVKLLLFVVNCFVSRWVGEVKLYGHVNDLLHFYSVLFVTINQHEPHNHIEITDQLRPGFRNDTFPLGRTLFVFFPW